MRASLLIPAVALSTAGATLALAETSSEPAFLKANAGVMERMMAGMDAKPSGDVDADFVNMMEPHHQGAIEMAELELRYGRNAQLRRIAQEIIIDQQQEIAAMRLALDRPLPPSAPAPTQSPLHADGTTGCGRPTHPHHAAQEG